MGSYLKERGFSQQNHNIGPKIGARMDTPIHIAFDRDGCVDLRQLTTVAMLRRGVRANIAKKRSA